MQCVWRLSSGSGSAAVAAAWPAAQAAAAAAGPRSMAAAAIAARRAPQLQTTSGRRSLHTSSTLRSDDSGDSSSSSSLPHAPAVSLGYSSSTTSGAVSAPLLAAQGVQVGGAGGAIPKQKVKMYNKMLRVVRSPVKGDVPNTQGDDYILGQDESESMAAEFPGLITANLSGPGRQGGGKRRGVNNGRAFGQGGRKASVAKVWIQAALTKGTGEFYVNGYRYVEYFHELDHRWELCAPFFYTGTLTDFDMIAVVSGGGKSGQAGAIKNAAAKALQNYNRKKYRPILKKKFLLSRDTRVVERKKYGQKKARKRFTFVKR